MGGSLHAENDEPFIYATEVSGEDVVVSVNVPSGYQSAVLEISNDVNAGWQPIVADDGRREGLVTFRFPDDKTNCFMRVRAGHPPKLPNTTFPVDSILKSSPVFIFSRNTKKRKCLPLASTRFGVLAKQKKLGTLLNRIAYGPHLDDVTQIESMGIEPYIKSQRALIVPPVAKEPEARGKGG